MPAELGHDFTSGQCVDHRCAGDEQRDIAIQMRLAFLKVAIEFFTRPVRARHMLDKGERPGAHDVTFRETRVLLEFGRAVDAIPGAGEIGQHRGIRFFQTKHHGLRIGGVDRGDIGITLFTHRQRAGRWLADAVIGRLNILRRKGRAIVKLHAAPQLEGIGEAVLRHRPRLGKITDDLWIFFGVEFEQR